jgi:hypothetical protein
MKVTVKGGTGKTKELAQVLSTIMNVLPIYKGGYTRRFVIGDILVEKDGNIIFPEKAGKQFIDKTLAALTEAGYKSVSEVQNNIPVSSIPDTLTIEMPLEGFSDAAISNLEKLITSKSTVLKKALNTDTLALERGDAMLRFPWFKAPPDGDTANAYATLITKMCEMVKRQKRVNVKETSDDNPKWVMRTFLLRLGFVGDEYKKARKVLTVNLDGDGSYRSGSRPENKSYTNA